MRPKIRVKDAFVSMYALPYHPMSSMELNSLVMAASGVAMINRS